MTSSDGRRPRRSRSSARGSQNQGKEAEAGGEIRLGVTRGSKDRASISPKVRSPEPSVTETAIVETTRGAQT